MERRWFLGVIVAVVLCTAQCDAGPRAAGLAVNNEKPREDTVVQKPAVRREVSAAETSPPLPELSVRVGSDRKIPSIPMGAKFVAPGGDDSGPGTRVNPWRSLGLALGMLEPGDTLVVRGGTYKAEGTSELCENGRAPFGLIGKHGRPDARITVMGYPGERPTLFHPDGWQTLYVCDSSYVNISHLEVHGDANSGNKSPVSGVYVVASHHVEVRDVWSHDNGGCGICCSESNHISILGNQVWGNSRWNPHQTSGISIYRAVNTGGGNNPDGYSNYIMDNQVWNNYEDDSLGVGQTWGVTDGNGIIIDVNLDSGGRGRTLVSDNIVVDNGGPGLMVTRSRSVDIISNTFYQNVRTRVSSVVNNGEIGCNGGSDIRIERNIVVPRNDNPNLFQNFSCEDFSHANNVWVRTGAPSLGPGDTVLRSGTTVISDPRLHLPSGCWTTVGDGVGRGARF